MKVSKYDNLLKLRKQGFLVPDFEIIRFEDVIDNKDDLCQLIDKNRFKSTKELSEILKDFIANNTKSKYLINLQCEKYAIRSSSNIEDGTKDSFAGQFDTYLNVEKKDIDTYIIKCFQSLYNTNVLDYAKNKNLDIKDFEMNVIIQRMVQAKYSGIIFTANPLGILNESVIVVGEGLGEDVVTDKISTITYYYNLNDKVYYFEGSNDYLDRNKVEEMLDISKSITKHFGKYLDIEFAIANDIIYILQVRKITTINDDNPLVFDNSNIVESYPRTSLPLTISFVNDIYSGVFRGVCKRILKNKKELEKKSTTFNNMIGSVNGRIYYKISNWYSLIKCLPFSKKIIPIWQEMLGVKNKSYDNEREDIVLFVRFMTYINSFIEFVRVSKNMKRLEKKFCKVNEEFYKEFKDSLNEEEILSLYNKVGEELLSCWDITLINDIYAFVYTGLLKKRLKKKYDNHEQIANKYISGISNIESLKPIKELIKIAYNKDKYTKEEYDIKIQEYIKVYGDRNVEELKLESKTFRTDPKLLEDKINEYRKDMNKLEKNYHTLLDDNVSYDYIEKEDIITRFFIKKCMLGIKNREISRLNRSRIFGMIRAMFLRLGEIYCNKGLIEKEDDIFYLTLDEIQSMASKNEVKIDIIAKRKEEYKVYKCLPAYSRIIFMNEEFDKHHTNVNMNKLYTNDKVLRGIPCSNGKVRAKALVITDINKAKDVKDKILITKMTDPGWVFLLATAKGIISEKGSLLSHTAIISRELHIPSIVGVDNLLSTIKTGDLIEMDASKGIINIIDE